MRHFATESGKSKGQFYTPAEVSRILPHRSMAEKPSNEHVPIRLGFCKEHNPGRVDV
jgi:hypothetical protein